MAISYIHMKLVSGAAAGGYLSWVKRFFAL
jgi:hypothetical protein